MTNHNDLLGIAQEAVAIGSQLMTTSVPGEIREKRDRDLVTELDVRIQHEVQEYLQRQTPDFSFLGEEEGPDTLDEKSEYVWALDPIDGTSNFAHRIPLCGTSLALVHRGEPVVAVIVAPILSLHYHALRDGGAFCNDAPIHATENTQLSHAIVSIGDYATGSKAAEKNSKRFAVTHALATSVERIRMLGAASLDLAWVAHGRTDACVILANKPWDTAAGTLLAREAGALVLDTSGRNHTFSSPDTVACPLGLSTDLLALLQRAPDPSAIRPGLSVVGDTPPNFG